MSMPIYPRQMIAELASLLHRLSARASKKLRGLFHRKQRIVGLFIMRIKEDGSITTPVVQLIFSIPDCSYAVGWRWPGEWEAAGWRFSNLLPPATTMNDATLFFMERWR